MPYEDAYTDAYPPDGATPPATAMPDAEDFYPWVDGCLQASIQRTGPFALDATTIGFIDRTILGALRDLVPKSVVKAAGKASAGAFYAALEEGDDKDRIGEAVGLLAAARLIVPLSTGGANGQLLSEKTESTARTFAAGPGMKEEWEARAAALVAECDFSPACLLSGGLVIAAAGPSRGLEERLRAWG